MILNLAALVAVTFAGIGDGIVTSADNFAVVEVSPGRDWSGVSIVTDGDSARRRIIAFTLCNKGTNAVSFVVKHLSATSGMSIQMARRECRLDPEESARLAFNLRLPTYSLNLNLDGIYGYSEKDKAARCVSHEADSIAVYARTMSGGRFTVSNAHILCGEPVEFANHEEGGFFPFCDKYGQFVHSEWPGKIHSDGELVAARSVEADWLHSHAMSPIGDADRFGGCLAGTKLTATGKFRVEKTGGRWHLVDPDGYLFFSFGLAGVRRPAPTKTSERERYFESLAGAENGRINFGELNIVRKYGADDSQAAFTARCRSRVRAWGFNTIANWSSPSVFKHAEIPYVDTFTTHGKTLKIGHGQIVDVFDGNFAANVRAAARAIAQRSGDDPWCIGWFVDNELNWGGSDIRAIARAAWEADESQPSSTEFRRFMAERRGNVGNADSPTDDDLREFSLLFADAYFRTVAAAVKEFAPGRLYLGCRFAPSRTPQDIWTVAARHVDVLSVNVYGLSPDFVRPPNLDRPIMIGEFHFGALDRGGLNAGVVPAGSQSERAELFTRYVRKAVESPDIVGAHYFLYQDQPLTGREHDGEGFSVGFVDTCDTPYGEMVEASRRVAASLYRPYAPIRNVRDFGAVGDGVVDDTAAIQCAIDAGGTVKFSAGTYLSGPIYLKSNGGLDLDESAVLRIQPNRTKWNIRPECKQFDSMPPQKKSSCAHLINCIHATNVFIRGGTVDGDWRKFYDRIYFYACCGRRYMTPKRYCEPAQLIWFFESENVAIDDVKILRAPYWSLMLHGCENVAVTDVTVESSAEICEADGIDIDCCRHVRVKGCRIRSGDDSLTVRANTRGLTAPQFCEDVVVEDCDVSSHYAHAIRVGVGSGEIRNCTFRDIRMEDTRGGIWVCSKYKSGKGVEIHDVLFENVAMDAVCGIYVRHDYFLVAKDDPYRGWMRDIHFRNVKGISMLPSSVVGNGVAAMDRISFEGCEVKVYQPKQQGLPQNERDFFQVGADENAQWLIKNADVSRN